jgi:hypothetical protein
MRGRTAWVLGAALAVVALVATMAPASAGPLSNKLICAATGNVNVGTPDPASDDVVPWTVRGSGLCTGDGLGPHVATVVGEGQSTNLGLCDGLVVSDLSVAVHITLVSVRTGATVTIDQTWRAPITTFPVATPFFIDRDTGDLAGAGVLFTRVGGVCPPGGSSGANMEWQFIKA